MPASQDLEAFSRGGTGFSSCPSLVLISTEGLPGSDNLLLVPTTGVTQARSA
jgi:hypothetical protein